MQKRGGPILMVYALYNVLFAQRLPCGDRNIASALKYLVALILFNAINSLMRNPLINAII